MHLDEMEANSCGECGVNFETAGCLKKHAAVVHGKISIECPMKNCR